MASWPPDILDCRLLKSVAVSLGMDARVGAGACRIDPGRQDQAKAVFPLRGSNYTAGISLAFPHGLGLSFFPLHLSRSPCPRNRTVDERTRGTSLAKLTRMWSERQTIWPRTFQVAASQSVAQPTKERGEGRPTPPTSALAAGQPYPSHSEHRLKPWSSQGPRGPAWLARHAYVFMGTFSSPCGLSCVTWQAKEIGGKHYLWLAWETFLP